MSSKLVDLSIAVAERFIMIVGSSIDGREDVAGCGVQTILSILEPIALRNSGEISSKFSINSTNSVIPDSLINLNFIDYPIQVSCGGLLHCV